MTTKPRITEEATSPRMAWSQYTSRENSTIVDLCVGQLRSSLTCDSCGYVSKVTSLVYIYKIYICYQVWDPFWDLSVPIPSGARDIQDCLNEFQKEEVTSGLVLIISDFRFCRYWTEVRNQNVKDAKSGDE